MLAKILYEDAPGADVKNFGLHVLVLRCVLERLGLPEPQMYALREKLQGSPRKGVSNLLKACEDEREARRFRRVFIVFDNDKIREDPKLALSRQACRTLVRQAIAKLSRYPDQLQVVLLEQNMESVVAAVQRCRGSQVTGKLNPLERDALLTKTAWDVDQSSLRTRVLGEVPSLAYLVDKLAALVSGSQP